MLHYLLLQTPSTMSLFRVKLPSVGYKFTHLCINITPPLSLSINITRSDQLEKILLKPAALEPVKHFGNTFTSMMQSKTTTGDNIWAWSLLTGLSFWEKNCLMFLSAASRELLSAPSVGPYDRSFMLRSLIILKLKASRFSGSCKDTKHQVQMWPW